MTPPTIEPIFRAVSGRGGGVGGDGGSKTFSMLGEAQPSMGDLLPLAISRTPVGAL